MNKGYSFGLIFVLSFLILVVYCERWEDDADDNNDNDWQSFKNRFKRSHKNKNEEGFRRLHWRNARRRIREHNKKFARREVTFNVEVNEFADYSDDELNEFLTFKPNLEDIDVRKSDLKQDLRPKRQTNAAPSSFSWVTEKAVDGVKNQGKCGGCWAFSMVGALEGAYYLQTRKKFVSFSEQQLIDCNYDAKAGNFGCNGGSYPKAARYLALNGLQSDATYSYKAARLNCSANSSLYYSDYKVVGCTTYNARYNETQMKEMLFKYGPVAIGIQSTSLLTSYKSGIYNDPTCSNKLNHAVLLVGYGTQNGTDYWIVKNSWGVGWGEGGYFRAARNKNNACGIVTDVCFIVLAPTTTTTTSTTTTTKTTSTTTTTATTITSTTTTTSTTSTTTTDTKSTTTTTSNSDNSV